MVGLTLLETVRWDGRPVPGERSQALLAELAAAGGRAVPDRDLVTAIWGPDDRPANPAKALQVVVSRTRTQTTAALVERSDGGYRLGAADVDAVTLRRQTQAALAAERRHDQRAAREHAEPAAGLSVAVPDDAVPPALEGLRAAARRERATARAVLGRALSALGEHADAVPLLAEVTTPDEATLEALLRSTAAAHGVPAALARYDEVRRDLADRLGVDPGPALQAVHAELLAADQPVRTGLRFDATSLVGRDEDIRTLRALLRDSRLVSIVGPGGLGKTRLAHLLAREADQPVVHFVELVGVAAAEDVLGEVGSTVGVRDSVTGRRTLSPRLLADLRTRLAHHLDQAPTLLVLDNCEHVVAAVADLVAPLLAQTRTLRILTTTRAPLALAAERVFALGQLTDAAAATLFRHRAAAARPGVRLDDAEVHDVVRRLDGLPLAVELAAAKVRAMSVADVARRLDDRFALLRGQDAGAPDRHRTLLAVIDWSWNLIAAEDRRALRRLSVFPDGFGLDGAEAVLAQLPPDRHAPGPVDPVAGDEALARLESLAGQSLIAVTDEEHGLRYRMLETVREFGLRQLTASDEAADAETRLIDWAVQRARAARLDGHDQVAVVRSLLAEENTLADVLRGRLAAGDADRAVPLLAALAGYWTVRGDHSRVVVLISAAEEVLTGWTPSAALIDDTVRATALIVMTTAVGMLGDASRSRELLAAFGPQATDPMQQALPRILGVLADGGDLLPLTRDPDRFVAAMAWQWLSHARENAGDLDGAIAAAVAGVATGRDDDPPWPRALYDTQLAGLYAQVGRFDEAIGPAHRALATLDALEADDDAIQLRAILAMAAISVGDLDRAASLLRTIEARRHPGLWSAGIVVPSTRAELALARGEVAAGLAGLDAAVAASRGVRFPGARIEAGLEPWMLFALSVAVAAYARHGCGAQGRVLYDELAGKARPMAADGRRTDLPIMGCVLFALGSWALRRDGDPRRGARLLALADRLGYSRYWPSMAWAPARDEAERLAPGALAAAFAALADRRGPDVLTDVRAALGAHEAPG